MILTTSFISNEGVIASQAPFLSPNLAPGDWSETKDNVFSTWCFFLLDTPYDWNYTVTAQAGLNGRTFAYPRGHMLGGSSSIINQDNLKYRHQPLL